MTTDYDADQINHRATLARAWLADDPDVDLDKGADALRALAAEDVPALLVEVARLQARYNAASILTIDIAGNQRHPDESIPVGELQRALFDVAW